MDTALRDAASPLVTTAPTQWREEMLTAVLRVGCWLGAIACVPSVVIAIHNGHPVVAAVDSAMLVLMIGLYLARSIPYRIRAALACAIPFMVGAVLLPSFGFYAQLFFMTSAVLSAILLNTKAGLVTTVISTTAIGVAGVLGLNGPEEMLAQQGYTRLWWLAIAINFLLVASVLTIAIGEVLSRLEQALADAIAAREVTARQRELLRTFVDTVPDVVYSKDMDGRFRIVNAATKAMLSLEHDEQVVGRTVFDLYPPELAARLHADDLDVLAGNTVINREVTTRGPDGRTQWYLAMKVPYRDTQGAITGVIGVSRNITDRKQLEEQLRQAQKMEAVGKLAGGVAHDFNNLLTIIVGFSEVLQAEVKANPTLREPVDAITDAADRAAALTRQLLAFSRQTLLQPKVLDLNDKINDTARMISRLIGEDIRVTLVLDPAIPRVRVDPGQLDQVLMNLAVNARDAMPDGGELRIATQEVHLSEWLAERLEAAPGPHVMIAVTDTGVGMSPEVQSHVFEPFFTTKGVGTGTGLGLSTVFGIVRQSGGSISVESEVGQGATFRIYLPVAAQHAAVATAMAGASAAQSGGLTVQ